MVRNQSARPVVNLLRVGVLVVGSLMIGSLMIGCGRPPVVETANLPLVASLRTALSARNEQWLEGVSRAVDQRREAREMSDAEHAHFRELIDLGQQGKWEDAEHACLNFERAQLSRTRK